MCTQAYVLCEVPSSCQATCLWAAVSDGVEGLSALAAIWLESGWGPGSEEKHKEKLEALGQGAFQVTAPGRERGHRVATRGQQDPATEQRLSQMG